jgi:anaerobic magnesium-protoporphyrin IX monomethyl ester cyclase
MDILFINPPYPVCESLTMPLGLLYLAARMEEVGHRVVLADLQLSRAPMRSLRRALGRSSPSVVGITSFSLNFHSAARILRAVKRDYPQAVTVWGGPHVTFDDEGVLARHPWVDAVVRGEGEEALVAIAGRVERGRGLEGVPGVSWRGPGGEVHRNAPQPFRNDLDALPRPAWHLLELSKYLAFEDGASLMTSRGCPHRCLFCVGRKMIGAKGRFRSPTAVVDEMEALARLGFQHIRVEDDLFTFRRERAMAICREMVRRDLRIRWRAYARVDTVDEELLEWMSGSGCERLLFGAESGSPEILRRIRKGITPSQTRSAVAMTRRAGIGVLASFVIGLPGETSETVQETVAFAESLDVPYSLNLLTPYVGTDIRERASELGLQILSDDWRLYAQGKPLVTSSTLGSWHLSRAAGRYRRRLRQYLEELFAEERAGRLSEQAATELHRRRQWGFLRTLMGENLVETCGKIGKDLEEGPLWQLARNLSGPLGMTIPDVANRLGPLVQKGHIRMFGSSTDGRMWRWA